MGVLIANRYNGPPDSANGGYACGAFSGLVTPAAEKPPVVVLHAPPPLATELEVRPGARRTQVWHGDLLVATVGPGSPKVPEAEPVTVETARRAESTFEGHTGHPFPTCFVCGVESTPVAGFPLAPGRVTGRDLVACTWTPEAGNDGAVPLELVWSALDCPGGWAGDPTRVPMVLGRMSAIVHTRPDPGRVHVVTGQLWRRHGRTANVGTALYDDTGQLLAKAASVWVTVDPRNHNEKG